MVPPTTVHPTSPKALRLEIFILFTSQIIFQKMHIFDLPYQADIMPISQEPWWTRPGAELACNKLSLRQLAYAGELSSIGWQTDENPV
jgi:hypothetical protein